MDQSEPEEVLSPRVPTLTLAIGAGVAVASIYYNQPMLGMIARDFPGTKAAFIPTATQLGYATGLFLIVPLGDVIERRRLIVTQFAILAVALVMNAMAPTVELAIIASGLLGMSATVAQQVVPFAAHLAHPKRRGAVVGTVMAGLLGGILLSRTVAGFVAEHFGWRAMFLLAAPAALAGAAMMRASLPRSFPESRIGYGELLGSLMHLWKEFAELRWAGLTQAMLFGGFSAFWSILALQLERPEFNLGSSAAGAFGIVGLVGILAAPMAGRLSDRHGPHVVVFTGAAVVLLSWILFGLWTSLMGLVVGVLIMDFGVQSCLISNQHIIYALRPEARSRLNTVFMGTMFLGGALGSAGAAMAWRHASWSGVAGLGVGLSVVAVGAQVLAHRARSAR